MTISQRGTATSATTASANSLACNKPTGVVSGDVMIALVTSNDGAITSTGWTVLGKGSGQPSLFNATWLYKVAGGSEGASYTFSNASGTAPPIIVSIIAYSGVSNTTPIAGTNLSAGNFPGSGTQTTEPLTITGATSTPWGLPIYSRSCRVLHSGVSDITTFAASGVTELVDTGVFSGGTVSYGHGIYVGTEATGNAPNLSVTATNSTNESDNVVASFTLNDGAVSATAGLASVTADARQPNLNAPAGVATATVAALQPNLNAPAGKASVTAAALGATVGKSANAGLATATAAALQPTTFAPAGRAQNTAAAYGATCTLACAPTAGKASVTVGTFGASVITGAYAGVAAVTVNALSVPVRAPAGVATGTAAALNVSAGIGVKPGLASATALARQVTQSVGVLAGSATVQIDTSQVHFFFGSTRIKKVPAETRTYVVPAENRTIAIGYA